MAIFSKIINSSFYIRVIKTLTVLIFIYIHTFPTFSDTSLDKARNLFLEGKYENALEETSKYKTAEARILESRILSIYTHFYLEEKTAEENFLKSYDIAKQAIEIAPKNDEAYVEAAHSLGRYGQKIGIMSAITKGIADRVKRYLNKALEINPNNILANLSKGIWHAEIVNQAGKGLAKAVYGAKVNSAIEHFEIVKKHKNSSEIGILYELAYGYSLLNEDIYLNESNLIVKKLLKIPPSSDMDTLYIKKGRILLEILP